jgi:hypothetical protein
MDNVFIFSEIVRCGLIGKVAFDTFHKHHPTLKLHVFGRKEDFGFLTNHPNTIHHYLDDQPEIIQAFDFGHKGTSMVWTKVILEAKEKYIIHIDSDVYFRGDMVQDVIDKLKDYDLVGGLRNYPNNPHKNRDDVRGLPDVTMTYCFGFNKEKIYVKEPELLRRLVENSLDYESVIELMKRYPQYSYVPTLDYFDPVAFTMLREGATIHIIHSDIMGGTNEMGQRINKYGVLDEHLDFGDKIVHFSSVGSGLNFLTMIQKGEEVKVPVWYVEYAMGKLDLYMRLFYGTKILADDKNERFLKYEKNLRDALGLSA